MTHSHTEIPAPWLSFARADLGNSETLGPNDSPWIRKMLASLAGSWLLGQPWCGGAVAYWMKKSGQPIPKHWYRAKGWLDWGVKLSAPVPGCVTVIGREGGGHVFFTVARTPAGDLVGLGGNQGNRVSEATFSAGRVLGHRWPAGVPVPTEPLPVRGGVSKSEGEA